MYDDVLNAYSIIVPISAGRKGLKYRVVATMLLCSIC